MTEAAEQIAPYTPLPTLPPGPYRSRGKILDYTDWRDRDRFVELDRRIARAPKQQTAEQLAARRDRIVELHGRGLSTGAIARLIHMSTWTVRQAIRSAGITAPGTRAA